MLSHCEVEVVHFQQDPHVSGVASFSVHLTKRLLMLTGFLPGHAPFPQLVGPGAFIHCDVTIFPCVTNK